MNLSPYLFQVVLSHKVEPTKTKCISKDYELIVELTKAVPQLWDSLNQPVFKNDLVELKKQIILEEHEKVARLSLIHI